MTTATREAPPRASRRITTTTNERSERSTPKPRPTVTLTNPVHRIRLKNLQELIENRFGGNATQLAKEIGKSHTYLWQLLHLERRIGENTARHIEEKLELGVGQLDREQGAKERTMVLIQHMGDGRTRSYRLVPKASLEDFDAKPSAKPDDLRPCPMAGADEPKRPRCSENTVWVKFPHSLNPKIRNAIVFVDKSETTLSDHALYVVRAMKGPLKGRALLREARLDEGGFVLRSLSGAAEPLQEKQVKVLGRAIYSVDEL